MTCSSYNIDDRNKRKGASFLLVFEEFIACHATMLNELLFSVKHRSGKMNLLHVCVLWEEDNMTKMATSRIVTFTQLLIKLVEGISSPAALT